MVEEAVQKVPEQNNLLLTPVGVTRWISEKGFQYYQVIGKDEGGTGYAMVFAVRQNYTEAVEKALARFIPVALPKAEDIKPEEEGEKESGPTEANQG